MLLLPEDLLKPCNTFLDETTGSFQLRDLCAPPSVRHVSDAQSTFADSVNPHLPSLATVLLTPA